MKCTRRLVELRAEFITLCVLRTVMLYVSFSTPNVGAPVSIRFMEFAGIST